MGKPTYEFLENKEWIVKTKFTQEIDIDVAKQLKIIRQYRAEFAKAWASLYELAQSLEDYCTVHNQQNDLLKQLWDYLGEDYSMPELKAPFDSKSILESYSKFLEAEKEFRKLHWIDAE